MAYTAHLDTFARDNLPPREQWPEFIFELPELQYPQRLNCATALLDAAVERGWGDRTAVMAPDGLRWTYADLLAHANRIAHVLVEDCGLVPGNRVLLRAPTAMPPAFITANQQAACSGLLGARSCTRLPGTRPQSSTNTRAIRFACARRSA